MKPISDLEALIRHLAGREDLAGSTGASVLGDPTSDASQLLEEIRQRTRRLFDESDPALDASGPPTDFAPVFSSAAGSRTRSRRSVVTGWLLIALLMTAASTLAGGLIGQWSSRAVETRSRERTDQILAEIRKQSALKPPTVDPGPVDPALAAAGPVSDVALRRLEVELTQILDRLDAMSRLVTANRPDSPAGAVLAGPLTPPANPNPDPNFAAITADLATIRRELTSGEAATTRQIQEMRTVLHEVNTVVRRVLSRPQPNANSALAPLMAVTVQALIHNLQHASAQVRGEAVEQLLRIGPSARTAIPALQAMHTREGDQNIRSAIETALAILSGN